MVEFIDRPIAFQRSLVRITGSVCGALLLSQAIFWHLRTDAEDGSFFKTAAEWEEETGMKRYELERAKKDCEKFLKTKLAGIPAKTFYFLDVEAIEEAIKAAQTSLQNVCKLDCRTSANKSAERLQSSNTETTSETTAESAAKPQPPEKLQIKKPVKKEKPLTPREQEFLDAWRAAYLEQRKVPYRLGGLSYQERAAIGRLMVSTDKPVNELIEWAKAAWRHSEKIFECKGSLTILGFETRFYDIMGKVKINAAAVQAPNAPAKKSFWDMTDAEKIYAGGLRYQDGTWGAPIGYKGPDRDGNLPTGNTKSMPPKQPKKHFDDMTKEERFNAGWAIIGGEWSPPPFT